jgi:hypothetical protein
MSPRYQQAFVFTDDRNDPCPCDVVWEEQPDDPFAERARPVWPDGTTVERVYRFIHRDCQRAVTRYVSEAAEEMA